MSHVRFIPVLFALLASIASAAEPFLIADVNQGGYRYRADYLGTIDGRVFHLSSDPAHGIEPWLTDGVDRTFLLDIRPGPAGSHPTRVGEAPGRIFFLADDGIAGRCLWVTDGTAPGTRRIRAIDARPAYEPQNAVAVGQGIVFWCGDPTVGREPWYSDGTPAGTYRLADIVPGSGSSVPYAITKGVNQVFFLVGLHSPSLWRTDGTIAGTRLVKTLTGFRSLVTIGDIAVFTDGSNLWRSDGTAAGTVLIPGVSPSGELITEGAVAFFCGGTTATGAEIWSTDGTGPGTRLFYETKPGSASLNPSVVGAVGPNIFYSTNTGPSWQLWRTDGSAGGAMVVQSGRPGTYPPPPGNPSVVNGRLLFSTDRTLFSVGAAGEAETIRANALSWTRVSPARAYVHSYSAGAEETALTDGTLAGTTAIAISQSADFYPALQRDVAFVGAARREMVGIDRVTSHVIPLARMGFGPDGSNGQGMFEVASGVLFNVDDGVHGREWWICDRTGANPRLLVDLLPGAESGLGQSAVSYGGRVYFSARSAIDKRYGLWSTDGTAAGTRFVIDFPYSDISSLSRYSAGIAFISSDHYLWVSDGTAAGTRNTNAWFPERITPFRDGLMFVAEDSAGIELHYWNGSDPQIRVKDIAPGIGTDGWPRSAFPVRIASAPLAVLGDHVYFSATSTGAAPTSLWRSDGTETGTTVVVAGIFADQLVSNGSRLFFSNNGQLYTSTGLPGSATLVKDIYPGGNPGVDQLTVVGSKLFFVAASAGAGREVWVSDGTAAGTFMVKDVFPGVGSGPAQFTGLYTDGARLFWPAIDGSGSEEIWVSDGTVIGTSKLTESSLPRSRATPRLRVGDLLFHEASTPLFGSEPWAVDVRPAPTITWTNPAPITYGQPLSGTQLGATATRAGASVTGVFVYEPPLGTLLPAGNEQPLTVRFTPTDATLQPVTARTTIDVRKATQTLSFTPAAHAVYGDPPLALSATSSSGLAPVYSVLSGRGRIDGSSLVLTGAGTVTVRAAQPGDANHLEAAPIDRPVTVGKAALTVSLVSALRPTGAANPPFSVSYAGFIPPDSAAALGGGLVFSTTATTSSPPGTYPVSVAGLTSPDYSITFVPGTLRIADFLPITVTLTGRLVGGATGVAIDGTPAVVNGVQWRHDAQLPLESGSTVYEVRAAVGATALPQNSITIEQVDVASGGG